jgi:PST family polysaccharide transporter
MFAHYFVQYFAVFVDFGFNYTGTRDISINKVNNEKIKDLFINIFFTKVTLLIIALILFIPIVYLFPRFRSDHLIYLGTFGIVIGRLFFPIWYFQGIEKMKYIAILKVASTLIFTIFVFIIITSKDDYILYPCLFSLSMIVPAIIAFLIAKKALKVKLKIPEHKAIINQLLKSKDVFISNLASTLYLASTPLILGITTNNNEYVSNFTIAEKTVRGIRYLMNPITQALFPNISRKFKINKLTHNIHILTKISIAILPLAIFMIALIFVFSERISILFTDNFNVSIVKNLWILSSIILLGTLNNVWGVLGMINLNLERKFRLYVLLAGVFNLAACFVLSHVYYDLGASIAVFLTELLLFILIYNHFNTIKN